MVGTDRSSELRRAPMSLERSYNTNRLWSVRPDVEIKRSPIYPKVGPKEAAIVFT